MFRILNRKMKVFRCVCESINQNVHNVLNILTILIYNKTTF